MIILNRNHKKFMKWCDLIDSNDLESQALNLIWSSHVFCRSIYAFLRRDVIYTISRKGLHGDSEVSWRHDMSSNIIYTYIKKGAIFDRLNMTLLLNNESLNNRLWKISNDNEERSLNAFFEHRMNSNRSKTTCLRFYRIACCLINLI